MSGEIECRLRSDIMSLIKFYESGIEEATIEWLSELGYEYAFGPDIVLMVFVLREVRTKMCYSKKGFIMLCF